MIRNLIYSSVICLLTLNSNAQCGPLTTLYAGDNGQDGIMFDIVALNAVVITGFDIDAYGNTHDYEIYFKAGTHVGFQTNAAAWTLVGTANGIPGNPRNSPTNIPVTLAIPLCAGDTYAFYITSTGTSGSISYTNGAGVGNVLAADANIQVLEGTGKDYPFGASFQPRNPNMTVYYNCAVSCCVPPTITFTPETCSGSCDGTATATVGAGGVAPYTYLWDANAGNQITQTATSLCAGTYNVDVTDATGCVASQTVTVTSGASSANATISPAGPFCAGDAPVNLTATDPGGTWSGTGITDPVAGIFDPSAAGPGTWTVTYSILGACGNTDTEDITVSANADASISPAGPFCASDAAVNLSAATPGGTWSGTGITDPLNGTFDPAIAGIGTHAISYSVGGICPDIQTINITVNASFDPTINPAGPFCEGNSSTNLAAVDPGGTWSGNGITNPVAGTFDPSAAGAGTHTITYTISSTCGGSDTEDILVIPNDDATITPNGPFCSTDAAVNLTGATPGGTWSGTGITNAALGTFDPSIAGPGTWTITYDIPGACGDTDSEDIIVTAQLDATINPVGPFCQGDTPTILTAADGGGVWSGTGISNPSTGEFDPSAAQIGINTITYTLAGACGDLQTYDITINPDADATLPPSGPFCVGLGNTQLNALNPGGSWSASCGACIDPVTGSFNTTIAGIGVHNITYSIGGACPDQQTIQVEVVPSDDASIAQVGPFCLDDPSVNLNSADPGGTWTGNGITNSAVGTFNPATAGPGIHTITYSIPGSCGASNSIDITVNDLPDVNFSADVVSGCEPIVVTFTNNTINSSSCVWDFGISTQNTCQNVTVSFPSGAYDINLTVTDLNGCTSSLNNPGMINSYPYPIPSFTADPENATILNPTIAFTNTSSGANSYLWDFDGIGSSSETSPNYTFPDEGSYTVTLTAVSTEGCMAQISDNIVIGEEFILYVPNAFTPDGDGLNEVFLPVIDGARITEYEFYIFNRWGEVIFYTENMGEGWNGTFNGFASKADVYVYKIVAVGSSDDVKRTYTGHVTLLR